MKFEIYCENCGNLMLPIRFIEDEIKTEHGRMYKTGRKRYNVSHLECQICGKKEAVDDTFAGKWYEERNNI